MPMPMPIPNPIALDISICRLVAWAAYPSGACQHRGRENEGSSEMGSDKLQPIMNRILAPETELCPNMAGTR